MDNTGATTGKTYRLTRISDIFEQLNAEQIPRCMDEIKQAMIEAKQLERLLAGQERSELSLDVFDWTDEAGTDLSITISGTEGDSELEYRRSDSGANRAGDPAQQ